MIRDLAEPLFISRPPAYRTLLRNIGIENRKKVTLFPHFTRHMLTMFKLRSQAHCIFQLGLCLVMFTDVSRPTVNMRQWTLLINKVTVGRA
jgi:hypothetical protein